MSNYNNPDINKMYEQQFMNNQYPYFYNQNQDPETHANDAQHHQLMEPPQHQPPTGGQPQPDPDGHYHQYDDYALNPDYTNYTHSFNPPNVSPFEYGQSAVSNQGVGIQSQGGVIQNQGVAVQNHLGNQSEQYHHLSQPSQSNQPHLQSHNNQPHLQNHNNQHSQQGQHTSQHNQHTNQPSHHIQHNQHLQTPSDEYYYPDPVYQDFDYSNLLMDQHTYQRKSVDNKYNKKESSFRPNKPVRQNSNPNMSKRNRPSINKSHSYNVKEKPKSTLSQSVDDKPQRTGSMSEKFQALKNKSLFDFNKKKPNFHLDLNTLKPKVEPLNSNSSNISNLKIGDKDLGLDDNFENFTPNMKPPGTNPNEYFDDFHLPKDEDDDQDLTGFNFEVYDGLKDFDYGNFDQGHQAHRYQDIQDTQDRYEEKYGDKYEGEYQDKYDDKYEDKYQDKYDDKYQNTFDQTYDKYEYDDSGDNSGSGYDEGLFKSESLVEPHDSNYHSRSMEPNSFSFRSSDYEEKSDHLSFTDAHVDKKSPLTPLSNDSPSNSKVSPGSNSNYLNAELYKVDSNQSTSSVNSSSPKDKKSKKLPKGASCPICGKYISRDLSRHLRIHDENGRFRCVFPSTCKHKTMKFNRPYDYKKHLLHFHFDFDDPSGKTANNLTEKLPLLGNCKACSFRSDAKTWLDGHVLTSNMQAKCPFVEGVPLSQ